MKTPEPDSPKRFSDQLESWLKSTDPKTFGSLSQAFGEKGLAVTILMLMILPALPLPTGGITHIFEFFTVVLTLPLLVGRSTIWLPGFIARYKLGKVTTGKFVPAILKLVRKLEHISRPRGAKVMHLFPFRVLSGLIIICLAVTAALAPPFSGLDTLPSMAVVIIALGIILDDFVFFAVGCVAAVIGIVSVVFLSSQVFHLVHNMFSR